MRRTIALCYVASGVLTSIGALFFAARLGTVGGDVGVGLEVTVLTAAVLGGISLGGGKGSVTKALVGTLIVLLIINGLTTLSVRGGVNRMVLAGILLVAAMIDIRWLKNRTRIIAKVYVSPTFHAHAAAGLDRARQRHAFAQNDKLRDVSPDRPRPHRGAGGRHPRPPRQSLCRLAPRRHHPLLRARLRERWRSSPISAASRSAWRSTATTISMSASAAWASTASRPTARSRRSTDETNRSLYSVNDDSRLRLADDLDITDDGRIFFSEATVRYEMHEWPVDGLEARGNGRIICYDPNTSTHAHGAARSEIPQRHLHRSDGQSILFAETWGCCVKRYWFDGPKKGTDRDGASTTFRAFPTTSTSRPTATTGSPWSACARPALDLAWRMPGFRKRMAKRVPRRRMAVPQHQHRLRAQVQRAGRGARDLSGTWRGDNHPMITSMREHSGYLYLGGIMNNRIGRLQARRTPTPTSSSTTGAGGRRA